MLSDDKCYALYKFALDTYWRYSDTDSDVFIKAPFTQSKRNFKIKHTKSTQMDWKLPSRNTYTYTGL